MAVHVGSASQFFLSVLLRDAGLSEKHVQAVNMTHGDAGAAFVAGRVDAAVTWEPWLSKGKAAPHGHMLVDSANLRPLAAGEWRVAAFPLEPSGRPGAPVGAFAIRGSDAGGDPH